MTDMRAHAHARVLSIIVSICMQSPGTIRRQFPPLLVPWAENFSLSLSTESADEKLMQAY